jgi:carboxylesterase
MKPIYLIFSIIITLSACNPTPEIDNATMLDGTLISDSSLIQPAKYLISAKYPTPDATQLNTPVIIAAHGYSATTFEWDELRSFSKSDTIAKPFFVSQVLLGGHGRDYADFKAATWEDWQSSIITEYNELEKRGYKKIYLAGSSTGAPLIINLIKTGFFNTHLPPKGIFLIDPIIVPANKTLTLVGLLGPVLGYTTTELATGEKGKWYVFRPQETLQELMELIDLTRKDLEKGVVLPQGTFMKVYKSQIDDVADPISALLIYKGIKTATGAKIEVEMEKSKLHVFTRLAGRDSYSVEDKALQQKVFQEIKNKMTN